MRLLLFFPPQSLGPVGWNRNSVCNVNQLSIQTGERKSVSKSDQETRVFCSPVPVGGGHAKFTGTMRSPLRVFSGVHSGTGQQGFDYSSQQRADLLLFFEGSESGLAAELHYHNYHGYNWHYRGHSAWCPCGVEALEPFCWDSKSKKFDDFRTAYAAALTAVNPSRVTFKYSVSVSCDFFMESLWNLPRVADKSTPVCRNSCTETRPHALSTSHPGSSTGPRSYALSYTHTHTQTKKTFF